MSRLTRMLLLAAAVCLLVVPAASAAPNTTHQLGGVLGDMWTTVLQTPAPTNPFSPGGDPCVQVGDVVAPFGPNAGQGCTVPSGTRIFAVGWSTECSTFEGEGTAEAALRSCAKLLDQTVTTHTITLDGQLVPVTEVETGLLTIHLPKDNIFGSDVRSGLSVAHGWVVLLGPLSPGTHTIEARAAGSYLGQPLDVDTVTPIIVQP
jgi:hypothetical protein